MKPTNINIGYNPQFNNQHKELYEVIRIENGIPLFIKDHLYRFQSGFAKLGKSHLFHQNEFTSAIHQLIKNEEITNCNIRISCFTQESASYECYLYSIPSRYPNDKLYETGIQTFLLEAERKNPNIKIGHTLVRENANAEIERHHAYEALLVNRKGNITEGSRSNVFFIKENFVHTAPSELVLPGIMRTKVLELIVDNDIPLLQKCIHKDQLGNIDAAFITGTSPRILPIHSIGEFTFNVNHPLLRNLINSLNQVIEAYKKKKADII